MRYIKHLFILLLVSVNTNAQKQKVFETVPEYLNYVKETGIDIEKLVIPNREDYYALGNEIVDNRMYVYYGVVYKSKLTSAKELELPSCWGQFRDLCKGVSDSGLGTDIEDVSYLKNLNFNPEKKTIVFIYMVSDKRTFKKNFKPVLDALKDDPAFDYIMLSGDTMNIKSMR